jgi:ribosomal protein L37E
VRSDLFSSGGSSGFTGQFGVERGSGYEPKTIEAAQSPLICPKCGKPCAGTAERNSCASCGFSSVAQQAAKATAPKLGVVENPCPECSRPLTVTGDDKRCNNCGWALRVESSAQRRTLPVS